jgi:hypothetical protein
MEEDKSLYIVRSHSLNQIYIISILMLSIKLEVNCELQFYNLFGSFNYTMQNL